MWTLSSKEIIVALYVALWYDFPIKLDVTDMAPNPIITTIQDCDPNNIKLTNQTQKGFYSAAKHKL